MKLTQIIKESLVDEDRTLDTISLDIPLFIRLLEKVLKMSDYENLMLATKF